MSPPDYVRVLLTFADGTVGVMSFITAEYHGKVPAWFRPPTPETIEKEIAKTSKSFSPEKLPVKSWRLIREEHIPDDRTYRDAWRDTGADIQHDMDHAREIHRNRLREARQPKLDALDRAYMRADERKDTKEKARIIAAKQVLRDLPAHPDIEKATTVAELKAVWHDELGTVRGRVSDQATSHEGGAGVRRYVHDDDTE